MLACGYDDGGGIRHRRACLEHRPPIHQHLACGTSWWVGGETQAAIDVTLLFTHPTFHSSPTPACAVEALPAQHAHASAPCTIHD